jgi:hypothetical protein
MRQAHHIVLRPPILPTQREYDDYLMSEISRTLTRVLVVGGEPSFVNRKLAPRLLRHLLRVTAHWPWKKANGTFPEDTELLFVLTDMCGHSMSGVAIEEAKRRGIPVVMGMRKHALNIDKLAAAGFPEFAPLAPKPMVSPKREQANNPIFSIPLPAIVLEDADVSAQTTSTEPTHEEPTVPTPTAALPPFPTLSHDERLLAALLASEPGLSNTRALEKLGTDWNYGKMSVAGAKVRRVLGISIPRNAKSDMYVDAAIYRRACEALGVTPVTLSPDGRYTRDKKTRTASVRPSPVEVVTMPTASVPAPLLAAYEKEQQTRREETPAAVNAPVPMPVPVPPPTPAPTSTMTEVATTVDALRLLLEAMRAEHVASVTVNDDGTVSMQRRVVVTANIVL